MRTDRWWRAWALGVTLTALSLPWGGARAAGSNPMAAAAALIARPPAGLSLRRVALAASATRTLGRGERTPDLAALARSAATAAGVAQAKAWERPIAAGAAGGARWVVAMSRGGTAWVQATQLPPVAAGDVGTAVALTIVVRSARASTAAALADALARALTAFGRPRIAVEWSGAWRAPLAPLAAVRNLARRMGAVASEAAGGPREAVLFARLPGAPAVAVAGRELNVEVCARRAGSGLVIAIGTPFLLPALAPVGVGSGAEIRVVDTAKEGS
jgi:hypothetical protein